MEKGAGISTQRKGSDMVEGKFPHDIIKYQDNTYGVDRDDKYRVMSRGLSNVAYFRKFHKKDSLGIDGFRFLQRF